MIFDRIALMGTAGALVVAVALTLSLNAGKAAAVKDRDKAVAERNAADGWADTVCGYVRVAYRPLSGKRPPRATWGAACAARVLELQQRVDGERERLAQALQAQAASQAAKYSADLAAARRNAARRSDSLKTLEAADAAITNGHYPHEWWVALGDTLGLRPAAESPAAAEPGSAGAGGAGAAAR